MLTHDQAKPAYDSLEQADAAFADGDEIRGAQRLWNAFTATVAVIARERGLPCADDDDIREVLAQLAGSDDEHYSMMLRFHTALRFRDAVAKGSLEDYEVEIFRPEVRLIIDELAALA